jgi:hypothetical protein
MQYKEFSFPLHRFHWDVEIVDANRCGWDEPMAHARMSQSVALMSSGAYSAHTH